MVYGEWSGRGGGVVGTDTRVFIAQNKQENYYRAIKRGGDLAFCTFKTNI